MQTQNRSTLRVQDGIRTPFKDSGMQPAVIPTEFDLTFLSQGRHFVARQQGRNIHHAAAQAMVDLSYECPDFNFREARLVRAVQVQ